MIATPGWFAILLALFVPNSVRALKETALKSGPGRVNRGGQNNI
jgi:hypothetical protein